MKTRNPDRIPKILTLMGQVWMENPDLRFFQLLTSLGFLEPKGDGTIEDPFYLEDDEILNAVTNKAKLRQRNAREAKTTGLKTTRPRQQRKGKQPPYKSRAAPHPKPKRK
jgi:hypothetical protein